MCGVHMYTLTFGMTTTVTMALRLVSYRLYHCCPQQVVVAARRGGSYDVRGGVLIRDPILSWVIVVKYTARNKFLAFGSLYRRIDDSMARKAMLL